jgi:hypothetical protein
MIQILLIVFAVVLVGSNLTTWSKTADYYNAKADAVLAQQVLKSQQIADDLRQEIVGIEAWYDGKVQQQKVVTRTITKEVQRVIQSDPIYVAAECRIPDAGVRLYTAAAAGVYVAPAAVPVAAVPAATGPAQAGGNDGRPAGSGNSERRPISRLPAAP